MDPASTTTLVANKEHKLVQAEGGLCGAEPEAHMGLDLWLLLLLTSLAGKRSEAVHKLLKKKFAEGLADNVWLDKAVCGHQVSSQYGLQNPNEMSVV